MVVNGLEQMRGWFKGYFRGSRSALFFCREMCNGYFNGYFFLVNHDFARLSTNRPSDEILIMPVIFVHCERTVLLPEKRDRDPIFTTNKQQREVYKSCSILPD